ncbi:MAG: BRO-N domain-containing protein [Acidithiobacillus ferriphilus]
MQEIVPFDFQGNRVRVIQREHREPWFHGNDVCVALGFGNPRQAIDSHVDQKDVQKLDTPTAGGVQQQNYINESGVYALILGSTKPEARAFKRWVTHEVLPTIRKTGSYALPGKPPLREVAQKNREIADLAQSYSALYRVMGLRGAQRQLAIETVLRARHGIELDRIAPLPHPTQRPAGSNPATTIDDRLVSPTQIGSVLGKTAHQVNLILENLGFQVRQGKGWKPTDKANGLWEWVKVAMHHAPFLRWRESAILGQLQGSPS